MALIVDDDKQNNFKHFCKICKKGFGCGRALGGHMRAHGIGDEGGQIDEDDPESDWDDKNTAPGKRTYSLRTNPNRLKSCRACENCGKEFSCWKSFLSHDGKCGSEDAESLVSSPACSEGEDGRRGGGGWSKRKRSLRTKAGTFNSTCPLSEEEDLANCLIMLSNATVDPPDVEPEESCASASKEEERRHPMNFMISAPSRVPVDNKAKGVAKGLFECKACKKVFNSHQALGGHRASHKKVKGCFASRLDQVDDSLADEDVITHDEFSPSKSNLNYDHVPNNALIGSSSKRKMKVHECSICHRVFSSGQALGGHKRCHWITSNSPVASSLTKFQQFQDPLEQVQLRAIPQFQKSDQSLDLKLDLNFPAPKDDLTGAPRDSISPPRIRVSTDIYLQPWRGVDGIQNEDSHHRQGSENENENEDKRKKNNENSNSSMQNVDDEADSKVKLAKLSDLKDINSSGGSSPWLQVGIGSTTAMETNP